MDNLDTRIQLKINAAMNRVLYEFEEWYFEANSVSAGACYEKIKELIKDETKEIY